MLRQRHEDEMVPGVQRKVGCGVHEFSGVDAIFTVSILNMEIVDKSTLDPDRVAHIFRSSI